VRVTTPARLTGLSASLCLLLVSGCERASSLSATERSGSAVRLATVDGRQNGISAPANGTPLTRHSTAGAPLALQLTVTPGVGGVDFALTATNTGDKRHEVRFEDGQEVEFAVRDDRDRTVWRWSAGRLFTQPMRTHLLEQAETMRYDASWQDSLPRGEFTAVATLRSTNHPATTRVAFTLR
jgi:hypothetical protein